MFFSENLNSIELVFLSTIIPLPNKLKSFSAKGLSLLLKVIPKMTLLSMVRDM